MNAMLKSKPRHDQGFSLMELVVVVAIISTVLAIAGIYSKQWLDKYNSESQIRKMHSDLLLVRVKAMEKNKQYFVVVNTGSYQVIEDTNENGVPDASDTWQALNTLNYQVLSSGTGTITMDQRGIISTPGIISTGTSTIPFYTGAGKPEYDCMQLCATRINIGRMNGTNCAPR